MAALVGLVGMKRSGKDSVAARLTNHHGWARLAFADPLKDAAYQTDPLIGDRLRLRSYVNLIGWEAAKETKPEVRRFLQDFGVAMRETIGPDVWVRPVREAAETLLLGGVSVVVTDVRFPNEIQMIRSLGGRIARVNRPGLPDDDRHPSENLWRVVEPEYEIENDGSLEDLEARADLLEEWVRY